MPAGVSLANWGVGIWDGMGWDGGRAAYFVTQTVPGRGFRFASMREITVKFISRPHSRTFFFLAGILLRAAELSPRRERKQMEYLMVVALATIL